MAGPIPKKILMLGCGTVGQPLLEMLAHETEVVVHAVVVTNPADPKYAGVAASGVKLISAKTFSANRRAVLDEVDIVVEVIGASKGDDGKTLPEGQGFQRTRDWLLEALQARKHVVTANKTVIARYGTSLFAAARASGCNIAFEAAVGGSIPIIRLMRGHWRSHQKGMRIRKVIGILNGTCNFILSQMSRYHTLPEQAQAAYKGAKNPALAWALEQAQKKGLAEADPSADLSGDDAAQKLAILSSLAFGCPIPVEKAIPRTHLDVVSMQDLRIAGKLGYVVKQLAVAERRDDPNDNDKQFLELRVHPSLISKHHPLAAVSDEYNAIYVEFDAPSGEEGGIGHQIYVGKGAGGRPTATALFGDILDVAQHLIPIPSQGQSMEQVTEDEQIARYFLKSISEDIAGVFKAKTSILFGNDSAGEHIGILHIHNLDAPEFHGVRDEMSAGKKLIPDVIITDAVRHRLVIEALNQFAKSTISLPLAGGGKQEKPLIEGAPTCMRIED